MFTQMSRKSTAKRPYSLKQRALGQEETRRRIVEAAVELHGTLGPRASSICAIAERAGVTRLTVYRHFPTEADIYAACSSHYSALHPAPAPALWAHAEGLERVRIALAAFCAFYRETHAMWTRVVADACAVPAVCAPLGQFRSHLDMAAADLAAGFGRSGHASVLATLRHAVAFETWAQLESQGVGDKRKLALMLAWVEGVLAAR